MLSIISAILSLSASAPGKARLPPAWKSRSGSINSRMLLRPTLLFIFQVSYDAAVCGPGDIPERITHLSTWLEPSKNQSEDSTSFTYITICYVWIPKSVYFTGTLISICFLHRNDSPRKLWYCVDLSLLFKSIYSCGVSTELRIGIPFAR